MLVADIDVGRLLLINLELRDDNVSFHGVTPFYLTIYGHINLKVSRQLARRGAWLRETSANAVVAAIVLRFG